MLSFVAIVILPLYIFGLWQEILSRNEVPNHETYE